MFPGNMEFVALEQHKDLLKDAERMRLIKALRRQQSTDEGISRKVTNRFGTQMVKWGLKLQGYSTAPPPQVTTQP